MSPLILAVIAILCYLAGITLISVLLGDGRKLMWFLYLNGIFIALGLFGAAVLAVASLIAMLV